MSQKNSETHIEWHKTIIHSLCCCPADKKIKLRKAFSTKSPITLRLKPGQIGCGDELLLTATQVNRLQKAASGGSGVDLKMSATQIQSTTQRGGNLFSKALRLALPVAKTLGKTAGLAGLSFDTEKLLKKIFGNGIGPKEIQQNVAKTVSPTEKTN